MPDQYDLLAAVVLHEEFDLVLESGEVAVAALQVRVAQAPILRGGRVKGVKVDAIDAKGPLRDSDKRA